MVDQASLGWQPALVMGVGLFGRIFAESVFLAAPSWGNMLPSIVAAGQLQPALVREGGGCLGGFCCRMRVISMVAARSVVEIICCGR